MLSATGGNEIIIPSIDRGDYDNKSLEGVRNQALDILSWILGDEDMIDAGYKCVSGLKTPEEVYEYIEGMIHEDGKERFDFNVPEDFKPREMLVPPKDS